MQSNVVSLSEAKDFEAKTEARDHALHLYCSWVKPDNKQIAAAVGVDERTIRRWINAYGWKVKRSEYRETITDSISDECGSPIERAKTSLSISKKLKEEILRAIKERPAGIYSNDLYTYTQVLKMLDDVEAKIYSRLGVV